MKKSVSLDFHFLCQKRKEGQFNEQKFFLQLTPREHADCFTVQLHFNTHLENKFNLLNSWKNCFGTKTVKFMVSCTQKKMFKLYF